MSDPSLSEYGAIVIDEAHEHTIATDLLLGLLKELTKTRPELRIIIMSATINAAMFTNYFPGAVTETVSGREHKVTIKYLKRTPTSLSKAIVNMVLQVHLTGQPGDILVFVSGKREIDEVISGINIFKERFNKDDIGPLECFALHAKLSAEDQDLAVDSVAQGPPTLADRGARSSLERTSPRRRSP